MRKFLLSLIAVAGFAGCYVEDSYSAGPGYAAGYAAPAPVGYSQPEMVDVSPGVQVVYDYDYPVFFTGGFYWRWYGGGWYSSHYYNGGWGVAANVPMGIRGIDRPYAYAHYRPAGYVPRSARAGGGYNGGRGYNGNVGVRGNVGVSAGAKMQAGNATHAPAASHSAAVHSSSKHK
jgi:hypothetical protein